MIAPTTTQERDGAERYVEFAYPAEERRAVLTEAECAAMGSLLHRHGASWRAARHQVLVPLFQPIHAALAFAGCRSGGVSCSVRWQVLTDLERRGMTFWGWSEDEWRETIGRTEALGRTYMTVVAYLLGGLDGLHALAYVNRATVLAERVFGSAPVTATLGRVHVVVDGWGYDCKPTSIGSLNRVVCQALVVARSPHLEAVTRAHLDTLLAINRGNSRTSVALLSRVLATLGILPVGIGRMRAVDSRAADHSAEGMAAEWYGWCQRWRPQSARRSTPTIYWHLLKTGRWLAAQFPAVTTPTQWTQEVAVACVAAVNGMRTGDWSLASASCPPLSITLFLTYRGGPRFGGQVNLTVLPIAHVQQHQSVEVLALALESYAAGFVITFQLQSHGAVPFIDNAPALALRVTDDRGGQYPFQPSGATGEGTRNAWRWRLVYRCTPALDPHARALHLEIADITWHRPDAARQRFVPARIVSGPWLFTVALLPPT